MAVNTKNLANGIVLTAPTPATSGTTLVLETGYGSTMPAVPFFLTCTPAGQLSTMGNSEVVLVTARTDETLTIERAKKGTTAKSIATGWVVSNSVYVETSTQVGDIITTLNASPRTGRLFMDGGTYTKAAYPLMWQYVVDNPAYGTTTSTNFVLKDMRGNTTASKTATGTFATLGAYVGSELRTLVLNNLPPHFHSIFLNTNHTDGESSAHEALSTILQGGGRYRYRGATGPGHSGSFTGGSNDLNGNASHSPTSFSLVQPTVVVNYEVIAE